MMLALTTNGQPSPIEVIIFAIATVASIAGFLASLVLYGYAKWQVRPNRTALRCLYQYSAIFFAGSMLLTVDWMMGDRAPVPIRPPMDATNRIGFASVMVIWSLTCVTLFMVHRALRVVRKPDEQTPEGRNFQEARSQLAQGNLVRGRIVQHRRSRGRGPAVLADT